MTMWEHLGRQVGLVLALGLVVGIAGCDYWPPALQTQIEQLRSEIQTVTAEKTLLQNQVDSLSRVKEDLQTQVDNLSRANRDKTTMITSLQNSVTALQARLAKSAKAASAKTSTAKSAAKSTKKAPVKKKTSTKSGVRR
jgi:chromosome segregation ATPase